MLEAATTAAQDSIRARVQVVAGLVDVYDFVLPCFPPSMDPMTILAKAYTAAVSRMLDALGQAAASFDNGGARPPLRAIQHVQYWFIVGTSFQIMHPKNGIVIVIDPSPITTFPTSSCAVRSMPRLVVTLAPMILDATQIASLARGEPCLTRTKTVSPLT